jgi:hypothetical protein
MRPNFPISVVIACGASLEPQGFGLVLDLRICELRRFGLRRRFGKTTFALLVTFIVNWGRALTVPQLVPIIYGDDPDGGPLDPLNILHVMLWSLERHLTPFGLGLIRWRVGHYEIADMAEHLEAA